MSCRLLVLICILGVRIIPAWGERVFFTVDPTSIQQDLKFDVNTLPVSSETTNDLNFSPNIVFSPDSQKAFVSYPGSDKVLAFHPKTGQILSVITVQKNPAQITLTPDGKRMAVVCLFLKENAPDRDNLLGKQIGAVCIIDVATFEVKTLNFTQVQFSFANNIVFSGDGKTGFLASFTTDEILRFDVDTAAEITPRLKMPAGTRPASLTMSSDCSFFTAVLVGSSFLDRRATPDTVQIIDTAAFSVRKSLATRVKADEVPYNFMPVNTVALSGDGKLGAIADQGSSVLSSIPGLAVDRALLFDTTSGEILKIYDVGGVPGGVTLSPDGRLFIIVSEIEVVAIDIATKEIGRIIPPLADFKPTNRPVFAKGGTVMYLALPLSDQVIVFDMRSGEIRRLVDVGKLVQPPPAEEDDSGLTAAPLELAVTPDGEVLAAVNFNANTVDLLKETQELAVPQFFATPEWFTGVALSNQASTQTTLVLTGYSNSGIEYQDENTTTDVVEYVNPKTITLGPGQQTSFTAGALMEAAPGKTVEGWLQADSDLFQTTGFYLLGDMAVKRMDGGTVALNLARTVLLPEVRITDGFRTEVTVLNPSYGTGSVTLTLYNGQGEKVGERAEALIPPLGVFHSFVRDTDPNDTTFNGLFTDEALADFTDGYLIIESVRGIAAVVHYYDGERLSVIPGVPVGEGLNTETSLFAPQVAAFGGTDTILNLVYLGSETAKVTLTWGGERGEVLGGPLLVSLDPRKTLRRRIADLFGVADPGRLLSGWLRIEADKPGLVGDTEIQVFSGKGMATPLLLKTPYTKLVFSHVARGAGVSTGLSLLNPGTQPATLQIEVYTTVGTVAARTSRTLAAGERLIGLIPELFPELGEIIGGYITVTSDSAILGLEMFFLDNQEFISVVPAERLPQE